MLLQESASGISCGDAIATTPAVCITTHLMCDSEDNTCNINGVIFTIMEAIMDSSMIASWIC